MLRYGGDCEGDLPLFASPATQSDESESLKCRYDWHQTATTVVLAIYAKMYHYAVSRVEVSGVRLRVALVFPQQNDAEFNMDLELRGVSFSLNSDRIWCTSIA